MFSETVLDHFQTPRNNGVMDRPDAQADEENPVCGDRLRLWLRIEADAIVEMRWKAEGCVPAIAAASVTSELVRGMSLDNARNIDRVTVAEALGGLPSRKAHAAMLATVAVRKAVDAYLSRRDSS